MVAKWQDNIKTQNKIYMKALLNVVLICILFFGYVAKADMINIDYYEPSPMLSWKQWQKQKTLLKECDVDFSKISKNHPRIFFKDDEIALIKSRLDKNILLKNQHDKVLEIAEKSLTAKKLVFKLDKSKRRILGISREFLKRIAALSYAYKMTADKKYLLAAEREMLNASSFKDWNPSHYLDTAEMALAIAVGYDSLYNNLSQSTRNTLETALIEKALKHDSWGFYSTHNWNQVCNAGVLAAAFAIFEKDKDLAKHIIVRSINANPISLQAYAPDGVYPEGVGYWEYGTSFQTILIDILRNALGNDFGISKNIGLLKSAKFVSACVSHNGMQFNFSDNGTLFSGTSTLFWFVNETNDFSILTPLKDKLNNPDFWNTHGIAVKVSYPRLMPLFLKHVAKIDVSNIPNTQQRVFYARGFCAVATVKTSAENKIFLGVKAGKGNNGHGHLDAGSFVFDIDEHRWIEDIKILPYANVEAKKINLWSYNKPTSERWSLIRYINQYHSTLTADGKNHNISAVAPIVAYWDSKKESGVKIDIQKVLASNLKKAERTFKIIDEKHLEITDVLQASDKDVVITFPLPSCAKVKIVADNKIELSKNECVLSVVAEGNIEIKAKMFDTSARNPKDEALKGYSLSGFEYTIPAGKFVKVKTTFKIKK